MKRVLLIILVVAMTLSLIACGGNNETITAECFASSLENAGFPISDVEIYDEDTDPNEVMGESGEYIGKFNFTHEPKPETYQSLTIEIFEKESDAKKRAAYIKEVTEATGWEEHIYLNSSYLLRIPVDLTTEEADLCNTAFSQIISDESVDDVLAKFEAIQKEIDANKSLEDYEYEFTTSNTKDEVIEKLGDDYEEYAYLGGSYLAWSNENGVLEVAFDEDNSYMYAMWWEESDWENQKETHIKMMEEYPKDNSSEDDPQEDSSTEDDPQEDNNSNDDTQEDSTSDEMTIGKFASGFNFRIENTIGNYADYAEEDIDTLAELLINMPTLDEDSLVLITSDDDQTLYGYAYCNITVFLVTDPNGIITSVGVKDDNYDEEDLVASVTLSTVRRIIINYITYSMFDGELSDDNYKTLNQGGTITANGYIITKPKNDIAFLNKVDDDEYNELFDLLITIK